MLARGIWLSATPPTMPAIDGNVAVEGWQERN
ncbi:hypothetical protein TBK1r_00420 [Stieleria magnilauensis]|uniref:Uncharacterized protein n=1 Tax=Stieleria magnilauensis TaxID=2527963 RepID=A0ABX5XGK4_9BACT|nr:hypothetical protein TBK1r_00420 [Planctomycetes bacterium TBK1r]